MENAPTAAGRHAVILASRTLRFKLCFKDKAEVELQQSAASAGLIPNEVTQVFLFLITSLLFFFSDRYDGEMAEGGPEDVILRHRLRQE